jgi:bla regulator protein blaR1
MRQGLLILGIFVVITVIPRFVEGQQREPLAFEAATIKPSAPDAPGETRMGIRPQPGGRFTATNLTLRMLIQFAYNLHEDQISGRLPLLDSDRYDVVAKGDSNATTEELRQMLRSLLIDRFKLRVHYDTKELPLFVLVRKGGLKLKEVVQDDTSNFAQPPGKGAAEMAGSRGGMRRRSEGGSEGGVSFNGVMSMDQLAQNLSGMVGRKVLNKTGLQGNYDVKLDWTPQPGEMSEKPGLPSGGGAVVAIRGERGGLPPDNPANPNGLGLFTAIQEQLGLKLDSQKGPVDILVIDGAAKPTEN